MEIKESHISDRYTKGTSGNGQMVKAKALKKASKAHDHDEERRGRISPPTT